VSLALPARALAWDAEGHRIIAHLAYERLTPKAKAQIAALIANAGEQGTPSCAVASLEDASTWPDCIRPLHGRWDYLAPMRLRRHPDLRDRAGVGLLPERRLRHRRDQARDRDPEGPTPIAGGQAPGAGGG
jgi:hypothetical protein